MAGVQVRPATEEDIPATVALFDKLDRLQSDWRVFDPRPSLRGEAERRYREALADPAAIHVVAEEGGRLVGMASDRVAVLSSISDEASLEVTNVFVSPSHRRRGLARRLISALAMFARDRGVLRLVLKTYAGNQEAMRFWEALGFQPRYVQMIAPAEELAPPEPPDQG